MEELYQNIVEGQTSITLSFPQEAPELSTESTSLPLQEHIPLVVSTEEITAEALGMAAGARVLLLAGMAAGAVFFCRALIRLGEGKAFTSSTISSMRKLYLIGVVTWIVYQAMLHFAANMILRDLDSSGQSASGMWGGDLEGLV